MLAAFGYKAWQNTSAGCIGCHSDRKKLEKLGYPGLYVTKEIVEKQSHHQNVTCRDCHLGNGRATDMKPAMRGLPPDGAKRT